MTTKTVPAMTKKPFTPSTRGTLSELIKKPSEFSQVAPESPRPPEMLTGVEINQGAKLNALDIAVHELLISCAYAQDPNMGEKYWTVPMKALTRFLGPKIRKEEVADSIRKLRNITVNFVSPDDPSRSYSDVRMIDMWSEFNSGEQSVAFCFPIPIRTLMRRMPRYAHLELAVIADGLMSTKWGPALYKKLLLESKAKAWRPGGEDNTVFVQLTPDEIANAVGFPRDADGNYNPSRLTDFVIRTVEDLKKVRRFSSRLDPETDIIREPGRGRRIRYYNFHLVLQPPQPYLIHSPFKAAEIRHLGGADDPRFHIDNHIWIKAAKAYDKSPSTLGWMPQAYHDLWLYALTEALYQQPKSDGYDTAPYRGDRLLSLISDKGAEYAAWCLLADEDSNPDLVVQLSTSTSGAFAKRYRVQLERTKRLGKPSKKLKRSAEREEQQIEEFARVLSGEQLEDDTLGFTVFDEPVISPTSLIESALKVKVVIKPDLNEIVLDKYVLPLFEQEWTGRRELLMSVLSDEGTSIHKIKPTPDEWSTFLVDIADYSTEVSYS